MLLRLVSLLVWALVAGSAVFWGFKLFSTGPGLPPQTQVAATGGGLRGDLTRLLGAEALPAAATADVPAPVADARFSLLGVVSPRSPAAAREGVALIAVDGKPARAYRVGAVVEGSHVLKDVSARGVTLGLRDGPGLLTLELPPLPPPATGQLPAASSQADAAPGAGSPPPGLPMAGRRPPPLGVTWPPPPQPQAPYAEPARAPQPVTPQIANGPPGGPAAPD
jgi:general secretion pathway protein C